MFICILIKSLSHAIVENQAVIVERSDHQNSFPYQQKNMSFNNKDLLVGISPGLNYREG